MDPVSVAIIVVLAATTAFFAWRVVQLNNQKSLPASSSAAKGGSDLEKKVSDLQNELKAAKDEARNKQKQLEEAREEAKKKLARAGKKAERDEEAAKAGPDPRDTEIAGLKKGMAALESQLNAAKRESEKAREELERGRGAAASESEGAARARDDAQSKSRSLAEENAALKKTLDELRHAKRKENERPDVPGTALDLKALPPEAVQELARYFRKGEEFERLYHVAGGQLQLEKDRYQELQRRYFAVCRELALAAGQKPGSDADARVAAEGLVSGSDALAGGQPRTGGAPGGGAPATAGAPGQPGEGQKKRRRRRRKKKPGAQGELPGTIAAGAEEHDDGPDDGHDDGHEGDEEGPDEADAADVQSTDTASEPPRQSAAPAPSEPTSAGGGTAGSEPSGNAPAAG